MVVTLGNVLSLRASKSRRTTSGPKVSYHLYRTTAEMKMDNNARAGAPLEPLSAIRWPPIPGTSEPPNWTGHGFRVGNRIERVLVGTVGNAGWSDELADLLDQEVAPDRPIGVASRRYALNALSKHVAIRQGTVLMDIGCANGYMLQDMQTSFPNAAVIGCDYAVAPLKKLSERIKGVPLLQLDLVNSQLPDQFCDAIVLLNVLEHIEDDETALSQVKRMLRRKGIFVIEVPSGPHLYDPFDRLLGHFRRYRMPELVQKLQNAGFEILDRSHLGFFAYPIFWQMKKRHQKFLQSSEQTQREVVMKTLGRGRSGSQLQHLVFKVETALRPWIPMQFGIRCIVTARAP
jgi:ubiquinone/menaquinone biosynthesis C-methylase UbiE